MTELPTWERPYYEPGGGDALLFYAVFGDLREQPLSRARYRSAGPPEGTELMRYERERSHETFEMLLTGYLFARLKEEEPDLAKRVLSAPHCLVLRGEVEDPDTLDYFRDTVGLLSFLLDSGGVALYDPLGFAWWTPERWQEEAFEPDGPVPRHHVSILLSPEDDDPSLAWLHTRGLRKFGRPDLSIHRVPETARVGAIDLCNRFIEMLAFGGVIPEGQPIKVAGLPEGMTCHHGGDLDDPDFNNVHIEIRWPAPG